MVYNKETEQSADALFNLLKQLEDDLYYSEKSPWRRIRERKSKVVYTADCNRIDMLRRFFCN